MLQEDVQRVAKDAARCGTTLTETAFRIAAVEEINQKVESNLRKQERNIEYIARHLGLGEQRPKQQAQQAPRPAVRRSVNVRENEGNRGK